MLILDKPYVSDFLKSTLIENKFEVLKHKNYSTLNLPENANCIEEIDFIAKAKNSKNPKIYSNSENAINWINNNLAETTLPGKINLFKDKIKFRDLIKPIFPDFFYQGVKITDLKNVDTTKIAKPFIIKPAVGFFSMGVYKVKEDSEWNDIVKSIEEEMNLAKELYPAEVIDSTNFIIEQNIPGKEFAIDVYFDENKKPVILNILEHIFPNEDDLTDRAYVTSKEIVEHYHDVFEYLLVKIGALAKIKNFPMHIEVKVTDQGEIIPIEINPMRFTGWCLTDLAHFAYNINIYDYFMNSKKPNWDEILKGKDNKTYSMIIASLPKDINSSMIESINWDKFSSSFENVLELRKIDYTEYPVFGFLFTETKNENIEEINKILKSDLKEFINLK